MFELLQTIDRSLFLFLNTTFSNTLFDHFFLFITKADHLHLMLVMAAVIFLFYGKIKALKIIGVTLLAMIISDLLGGQFLKPFFRRLRPSHASYFVEGTHLFLEGANFLLGKKGGAAFPSNHSMNAFTFATVLALYFPKYYLYYFIFAGLVAFSRIYVGVHYPSDVFAGAFLGVCIGMSVYYLFYYIKRTLERRENWKTLKE